MTEISESQRMFLNKFKRQNQLTKKIKKKTETINARAQRKIRYTLAHLLT